MKNARWNVSKHEVSNVVPVAVMFDVIHMHLWIDQQVLEMYLFCSRWKRGLHINLDNVIVRCMLFICIIDICYLYTLF